MEAIERMKVERDALRRAIERERFGPTTGLTGEAPAGHCMCVLPAGRGCCRRRGIGEENEHHG